MGECLKIKTPYFSPIGNLFSQLSPGKAVERRLRTEQVKQVCMFCALTREFQKNRNFITIAAVLQREKHER